MKVQPLGTDPLVLTASDATWLPQTHFGLTAEPATVAPGSEIRLHYRVQNASAVESPAAQVQFLLPFEARPLTDTHYAIPAIAAGGQIVLELAVQIASPLENGSRLCFQAALIVGEDEALGSNQCTVGIVSCAHLSGPGTSVRLAPGRTDGEVLVGATLANDGDARATDVTLVLPPPLGTIVADGAAVPAFPVAVLEAGDSAEFSYFAALRSPHGPALRLDGAYVCDAAGPIAALPASEAYALRPRLTTPLVTCESDGRRRHVTITVQNSGWAMLEDALVAITWPPEFRLADGSLQTAGLVRAKRPARVPDGCAFTISHIAAQAYATIHLDIFATTQSNGGDLAVCITRDGDTVSANAPIAAHAVHAIDMFVTQQPDGDIDAGTEVPIALTMINYGDAPRRIALEIGQAISHFCVDGKPRRADERVRLLPGAAHTLTFELAMVEDAVDGREYTTSVIAHDDGRPVAQAAITVRARNRVWLDTHAWLASDESGSFVRIANRGTTPARSARVTFDADGSALELGDIFPGTSTDVAITGITMRAAARGGVVRCGSQTVRLEAADATVRNDLDASITVPESAHAGIGIPVTLHMSCTQPANALHIRAAALRDAHIVTGSTRVNEHAIIDTPTGSVLSAENGLALHCVPASIAVTIGWTVMINAALDADRAFIVRALVDVDGIVHAIESGPVTIYARRAFAPSAHAFPFYVDGVVALAQPEGAPEAIAWYEAVDPIAHIEPIQSGQNHSVQLVIRLTPDRSASIARLLRGASMPGLVSHVFALRALFPDTTASEDPELAQLLALERDALRAVLDRLYVKMRIPGYDVTATDCEDSTARRSLGALLTAVWAHSLAAALGEAAIGAPIALYAVASLLPRECAGAPAVSAALEQYVVLLQGAFARTLDMPAPEFDETLARHNDRALDAAREELIEALDVPAEVLA